MPARAILVAFILSVSGPALADCKAFETGTNHIPLLSPRLSAVVIGTGRLQFYSAPNLNCAMAGVFIIPKDKVIAYERSDDGWTSVMYLNLTTGNDVQGWIRTSRLKTTGTIGQ